MLLHIAKLELHCKTYPIILVETFIPYDIHRKYEPPITNRGDFLLKFNQPQPVNSVFEGGLTLTHGKPEPM